MTGITESDTLTTRRRQDSPGLHKSTQLNSVGHGPAGTCWAALH